MYTTRSARSSSSSTTSTTTGSSSRSTIPSPLSTRFVRPSRRNRTDRPILASMLKVFVRLVADAALVATALFVSGGDGRVAARVDSARGVARREDGDRRRRVPCESRARTRAGEIADSRRSALERQAAPAARHQHRICWTAGSSPDAMSSAGTCCRGPRHSSQRSGLFCSRSAGSSRRWRFARTRSRPAWCDCSASENTRSRTPASTRSFATRSTPRHHWCSSALLCGSSRTPPRCWL